jgi:hypothetical protein
MFELFRHLKGAIMYLHTVTSSCILISSHYWEKSVRRAATSVARVQRSLNRRSSYSNGKLENTTFRHPKLNDLDWVPAQTLLFCSEPMNTFTAVVCLIMEYRDLSHLFALLNGPHYLSALLSSNEAAKRTLVYFLTFRVVHYSAPRTQNSNVCRAIRHGLIFVDWLVFFWWFGVCL